MLTGFGVAVDFPTRLQDDLIAYYKTNVPVKLHLFLNQPAYTSGDTLYFKATFMTAANAQLISGREVITVNLRDNRNNIVVEQKAVLNNGLGDGYLVLPDSIPGGIYTLTSFSSWMRNQDPAFFFNRRITISGQSLFSASTDEINFFPEGGKLIPDATNRIVVRAAAGTEGKIFSNGTQVASFSCNHTGLGSFFLKPDEQSQYSYSSGTSLAKIPFPVPIQQGINIQLARVDRHKSFRVVIQKSARMAIDETVHLLVWNHAQILSKSELSFRKKESFVTQFPTADFREGIHGLTLFTSDGSVLAERLFYVNLDSVDAGLKIEMTGSQFQVRDKVEAVLSLADLAQGGDFAVTVYHADVFANDLPFANKIDHSSNNIEAWFNFRSDIADSGVPTLSTLSDVDQYLVTQQWRRYSWPDVLQRKVSNLYSFESNMTFTGRAVFRDTGKPVPDSTRLDFLLQNSLASYETITDTNGKFEFALVTSFDGSETVYFQAYQQEKPLLNVSIILDDPASKTGTTRFVTTDQKDKYYAFSNDKREIDEVYLSTRSLKIPQSEARNSEILGILEPDVTIRLQDYHAFPTMRETIHEIIPFLKARTGADGNFTRIFFSDLQAEANEDPLYIIDGNLTDDTDYFLSLDPKEVSSVRLVHDTRKLAPFGPWLARKGLVIVETNRPEKSRTIPPTKSVFTHTGLNERKSYPLHQTFLQRPRIPDIRACIYWNPRVRIAPGKPISFSFQTPDNPGRYIIVIDGITSTHQLVHLERELNVDFPK